MKIELLMSREMLEQMLDLGERRIVGVAFKEMDDSQVEPTAQLVLTVDARSG